MSLIDLELPLRDLRFLRLLLGPAADLAADRSISFTIVPGSPLRRPHGLVSLTGGVPPA